MRTVVATRYVLPLREGGSLPALLEADDDGLYVCKLRGAGQGAKALVAEIIVGELARALGLAMPELVFVRLDPVLAHAEPDPEIQELLHASAGRNVGLDFLPGSLAFDPGTVADVDPDFAAAVVWLDSLTLNVDRTPHNPNLVAWHGQPWLIDHGAALYPQHADAPLAARATGAFPAISQHVLLPAAGSVEAADPKLAARLDGATVRRIVAEAPEAWMGGRAPEEYVDFLLGRLHGPRAFAAEAEAARRRLGG